MTKFVATILGTILLTVAAQANDVTGPLWTCGLDSNASGMSVGLFINVTKVEGQGVLVCNRLDNTTLTMPVDVKIGGLGLGFGVSKIEDLQIYSLNVGVTDPSDMLGKFTAGVNAGVQFIEGGAGFQVSVEGGDGLAFDVGVVAQQAQGLQVKAEGFALTITKAGEAVITPSN